MLKDINQHIEIYSGTKHLEISSYLENRLKYKPSEKDYESINSNIFIPGDINFLNKINYEYRKARCICKPRFDLKKLNKVGIDRIKIYVDIEAIDVQRCSQIAQIDTPLIKNNSKYYEIVDVGTGEVLPISTFRYSNNIENKYHKGKYITTYGLKTDNQKCNLKFKLDITAPKVFYNAPTPYNITLRDLPNLLAYIKKDLEEKGIYINYDSGAVYYLEINKNTIAYESLCDKHDILNYISNYVFKDNGELYPKVQLEKENSKTLTINDSRNSMNLYDKSAQLYNKFNLKLDREFINIGKDEQIYRFELKLKNIDAINRFFKTTTINELAVKDDMLERRFNEYINRKFVKKIKTHISTVYHELYNSIDSSRYLHIEKVYNKNKNNILDISILGSAMFNKYKDLGNESNFRRDFVKLIKHCGDESKCNSLKELEDLIELITSTEIKLLDIPPNIKKHINNNLKNFV